MGQLGFDWSVVEEVRPNKNGPRDKKTDPLDPIQRSGTYGPFYSKTDRKSDPSNPAGLDAEKNNVGSTPPCKREKRTDLGGEREVRSVLDPVSRQEPTFEGRHETGPNGPDLGIGGGKGDRENSIPGETAPAKNAPPPTAFDLRPYQLEAYLGALRVWSEGTRSALVVMPTGTGKTRVIGAVAKRELEHEGKTLVIAHREELLEQLAKELQRAGVIRDWQAPGVLEKAEHRGSLSSPAVVASIQSLTTKRLERYPRDHFTKIIVDEAHHSESPSYKRPLDWFAIAKILGVTATPDRADGKPLGDSFGSVAFTYEIRRAIADGYLVRPVVRRITVRGLDLSSVKSHHGDFDRGQLSSILAAEQMLHGVAKPLVDEAGNRKTIVFAVDVAHAHALAEVINRYRPGLAMALDGETPIDQRRAVLALFRRGEIQYLVNCQLLTEGFDEQSISCVAMARPTQSRGFYVQCLGRGFRVLGANYAESVANGKPDCLVLDFVGASKHALRGPADALAGSLDEATRLEVERILDAGETDVQAALELAEQRAAAARAKVEVLAIVEYRKRDVDPFLGDFMRPVEDSPRARGPATDAQRKAIESITHSTPPVCLTFGEASAIIDGNKRRQAKGLASIRQCKVLQGAAKLDTRGMTAARATELFMIAKGSRDEKPDNVFRAHRLFHEPEARRGAGAIHLDPKKRNW